MKGDGSLYKRGKVWWMGITVNGQRHEQSCKTTIKEVALARMRAEVQKSRGDDWLSPEQRRGTVGELVQSMFELYRSTGEVAAVTLKQYEQQWREHLAPRFGNLRADQLGTDNQRWYRSVRLAEGCCNVTVNRELQVIRRAYKLAVRCEPPKATRVPYFEFTHEDNARKVFIDSDVQKKLKDAAGKRGLWQRTFLEIAFTYGWRRGEITGLRVKNVDLIDGTLRLDSTKNGDAREVPITAGLRVLLQGLVSGRKPEDAVFPLALYGWQQEWTAICKLAGVKSGKKDGIILHDARRSSARNKRAAGVDTSLIMKMQGWKTDAMFRRYALVDRVDLQRALEQEQKFLGGEA